MRCTWTRSIGSRCYLRIQQWLHCPLQWVRLTKADLSENCWNLKYKIYFICHKHFLFIKTLSHKLFPHLHISVMTNSVFANWQQLVDNARVSLPIFPVAPKLSLLKTLNLLIHANPDSNAVASKQSLFGIMIFFILLLLMFCISRCKSVLANIPDSIAHALALMRTVCWKALIFCI